MRRALAALLCLALAGCGATHDRDQMVADHATFERDFKAGAIRLDCVVSCSRAKVAIEAETERLYANSDWVDLADEVIRVGARNDLAYFYLGSAAEGRGFIGAAKIYYRLSIQETKSGYGCDEALRNVCQGIVLPRDAEQRLERLS